MAYEMTDWATGDLITAERLNKMEQGIFDKAEKGDKGDPGATGAQGPKGDKGDAGAAGAKGATGAAGAAGVGVKSLSLTADADGKITGGTLTKTDNTTSAVTVTTA